MKRDNNNITTKGVVMSSYQNTLCVRLDLTSPQPQQPEQPVKRMPAAPRRFFLDPLSSETGYWDDLPPNNQICHKNGI
jgi:hypothetical protein